MTTPTAAVAAPRWYSHKKIEATGLAILIVGLAIGYYQFNVTIRAEKVKQFREILNRIHDNPAQTLTFSETNDDAVKMTKLHVDFETLRTLERSIGNLLTAKDYLELARYAYQCNPSQSHFYADKAKDKLEKDDPLTKCELYKHLAATSVAEKFLVPDDEYTKHLQEALNACEEITSTPTKLIQVAAVHLLWATLAYEMGNLELGETHAKLAKAQKGRNSLYQAAWEEHVDIQTQSAKVKYGLVAGDWPLFDNLVYTVSSKKVDGRIVWKFTRKPKQP